MAPSFNNPQEIAPTASGALAKHLGGMAPSSLGAFQLVVCPPPGAAESAEFPDLVQGTILSLPHPSDPGSLRPPSMREPGQFAMRAGQKQHLRPIAHPQIVQPWTSATVASACIGYPGPG